MISLVAAIPSSSGIATSITTTSGLSCAAIVTASRPLLASPTTVMSRAVPSTARKPARTTRWSSANKTRISSVVISSPVLARRHMAKVGSPKVREGSGNLPILCRGNADGVQGGSVARLCERLASGLAKGPNIRQNQGLMPPLAFLDRNHSLASHNYSRWLVPPAALAIHLSIGQAYAFSVFNLPLSQSLGITRSAPEDWKLSTIGWVFSVAIVFLGLSAALFGLWLDRVGPRKAMFVSALCFGGGFEIASLGVVTHQFWLLLLGYGVLGGIGLGLGYISPVTTLIRWFPDRPGMATGMAIMGFGGGAMIASPLSTTLMAYFKTGQAPGVASTFVTLGILYFCFMMFGVFTVRVPRPEWRPHGWTPVERPRSMITKANVTAARAIRT